MTTLTKLRAARALIERGWTQEYFAKDKDGLWILPNSTDAVCWCITGAFLAADYDAELWNHAAEIAGAKSLSDWNDAPGRTQADVLAIFDKLIAEEEQHALE